MSSRKTLDEYPNLSVECGARLRLHVSGYHPQAVRDFFVKYQDRILFGTDCILVDDPNMLNDEAALKRWQDKHALFYSRYLEYFETDHTGIIEPYGTYREWMRLSGREIAARGAGEILSRQRREVGPRLGKRACSEAGQGTLAILTQQPWDDDNSENEELRSQLLRSQTSLQ